MVIEQLLRVEPLTASMAGDGIILKPENFHQLKIPQLRWWSFATSSYNKRGLVDP